MNVDDTFKLLNQLEELFPRKKRLKLIRVAPDVYELLKQQFPHPFLADHLGFGVPIYANKSFESGLAQLINVDDEVMQEFFVGERAEKILPSKE